MATKAGVSGQCFTVGILILAAMSAPSEAGWLKKRVAGLGRAVGDVLTLCETCRERDRQKAEAAEAAAKRDREAAERLRQAQIQEISTHLARQDAVLTGQVTSLSLSSRLVQIQSAILTVSSKILEERGASVGAVEYVRDMFREESTGDSITLTQAIALKPLTRKDIEGAKPGQTPKQLDSLNEFVKSHGTKDLIADTYLADAIAELKSATVKELVKQAAEGRRVALELRQQLYNELLANRTEREASAQRLAAFGVKVSQTPESVLVAIKQLELVVSKPGGPADSPQGTGAVLDAFDLALDSAFEQQTTAFSQVPNNVGNGSPNDASCRGAFTDVRLESVRLPCS
jgi:hypothetical protein